MTVTDPFNFAADLMTDNAAMPLLDIAELVLPAYIPREHATYLGNRFTDGIKRAANGEKVRMIVCLPPGSGKSSLGSVALPLYTLRKHPTWPCAIVSADKPLALKFSRDVRRAILERKVPIALANTTGTVAAGEWETAQHGGLLATGRGGGLPGRRIRLLLVDDPIKSLADAYSTRSREAAWEMWQGVLEPRLWQGGHMAVIITTRWHEDDLAGRLIRHQTPEAPWEVIKVPAIAELGDILGRTVGEPLLSPQVQETVEQALTRWAGTRADVGEYVWEALYQQNPSPPGGAVFKRGWWQFHDDNTRPSPNVGQWITSWDLSLGQTYSTGDTDYSVGQVWQYVDGVAYLIDQVRGKWTFNEQLEQIPLFINRYPQAGVHLIEKAASATDVIGTLKRHIKGIVPVKSQGPKEVRAIAVAPMVEAAQVSLPRDRSFTDGLLAELSGFPTVTHDDQTDTLTQALKRLSEKTVGTVAANPASRSVVSGGMSLSSLRGRS